MHKQFKYLLAGVVVLGIAVQFAIPIRMITHREAILRKGVRVCFEAAAVDPFDVFRGRYVEIRLTEFTRRDLGYDGTPSAWLYAMVETNALGVAQIANVAVTPPSQQDTVYLRVKEERYSYSSNVRLKNPFNRFYMPEKYAPVAEEIYREMSARSSTNSVLLAVRIYCGEGVVEDLLVNGTPMLKAAQQRLAEKQ
ncbi:MAG: GDYXXLXY domain-containing protein [Kiritimatiellaeota bacterium]|nr:GDYXXLXY domain-containing protein [Kiritimatiellota bacterium]